MGSGLNNLGDIQILNPGSLATRPPVKFLRLAHLRRLKQCEKVAAVCYRVRHNQIEFLLVQTRAGRWTFPKGSAEPGLTHAQAAALEAFEEAGVHGRIEEAAFTRYIHRNRRSTRQSSRTTVNAHLCEVSRLEPAQESYRNPNWFVSQKAKDQLRRGRAEECGSELARVVDRAAARIRRGRGPNPKLISTKDL